MKLSECSLKKDLEKKNPISAPTSQTWEWDWKGGLDCRENKLQIKDEGAY